MKFGVHVSISGGIHKAPQRAAELGCDTFQIFVTNPRSWREVEFDNDSIAKFIEERERLQLSPVTIHITYLINLATPDEISRKKAIDHMLEQYRLSSFIKAEYFVIHPGSHKGAGVDEGATNIAESLNYIFSEIPQGPCLLLENTAGGGNTIGKTPEELGKIYNLVDDKKRVGICIDTCHAFASGENFQREKAFNKYIKLIEENTCKGIVKLLHANDSIYKSGLNKDRHTHIGLGQIGENAFTNIINTKSVKDLPVILETPVDDVRNDTDNLKYIQGLLQGKI